MAEKYTCAACGGVFDKVTPDDKANAEALELWGVPDASNDPDMAIVCDECFKLVVPLDES